MQKLAAFLLLLVVLLSACAGADATPTPIPTQATEVATAVLPSEATAEPGTAQITAVPFDLGDTVLVQGEWVGEKWREMPIRLDGMIAVPPSGDNLPIAVIIHGSHGSGCASTDGVTEAWPCPDDEKRHYEGFAYLLEALARQGYVTLAINANPMYVMAYGEENTAMRSPILFDIYMEQVAAAARGEDVGFPVDLTGRVDWSRLVALGHSKGGAAVNWIMDSRAGRTAPELISAGQGPLAAAVLLAPYGHGDPEGGLTASTAVILPACDRDLAGLDGQEYYERERMKPEMENLVTSVLLQWANHNRFNSTLEDDTLANGSAVCTPDALLPAEAQQDFLVDYVPRFFDWALGVKGDEVDLLGSDAAQPAPAALFGREVLTSLALPSAQRLRLPMDPSGAAGSATAIDCPREYTDEGGRGEACRRLQYNQPGSPEELAVSWDGPGGFYEVTLAEGSRDLSGYQTLHVRAVVDPLSELNALNQPQAFSVRLTDGSGATAAVPLAAEPALAFPYGTAVTYEDRPDRLVWDNNVLLSSIRVPLSQFAGVDLTDIRSIALVFDATKSGTVFITDLELLHTQGAE